MMLQKLAKALSVVALLVVMGCATAPVGGPPPGTQADVSALSRGISTLGPNVDPEEAARAARISYAHAYQLAQNYNITDTPLIHNTKVNLGLRERGLCYHWADDMETRLAKENFRTLDLHRAIANADNPFRIEHSTLIISARGEDQFEGVVLDPWRKGGELHWAPTLEDTRYNWRPREEVFAMKRARRGE